MSQIDELKQKVRAETDSNKQLQARFHEAQVQNIDEVKKLKNELTSDKMRLAQEK